LLQGSENEQELTATELSMLRLLMQKAGKPVSKQQLLDSHYGWQEEKADNLVEVYIRRLRRKIGEQRIRTLRGQGYVLQQGDN
jgi:DNA-binding response OmpR family regulator